MDLFTLKNLLRHEFVSTTENYVEAAVQNWRARYNQCHELARLSPTV